MCHRRSTGRIRPRFYFSDVSGGGDLREPIFSWNEHRSPADRETNGRDRARRKGGRHRPWRNREGERSGPLRTDGRSTRARVESDRAVAGRTISETISWAQGNDCVREEKQDPSRGECSETVLNGSKSPPHQFRERGAGRSLVRREFKENARDVQIERRAGGRARRTGTRRSCL